MATARPMATNRGVQLSVGLVNVLLGTALALFMNYFIRDFPLLLPRQWYDSYWMPLGVACLVFTAEAIWLRLRMNGLYGLLITAPPYGWHAAVATVIYLENRAEVGASEYFTIALPALLLALSGGLLNPVISRLFSRARRDRSRDKR